MFILKTLLGINTILNDAPTPWAFGFQDGGSPTFEGIVELHNQIIFYIIIILVGVFWVLSSVIQNFNIKSNKIVHKYHNHGTLIELVWTISPALILIAIAFPSFKLLVRGVAGSMRFLLSERSRDLARSSFVSPHEGVDGSISVRPGSIKTPVDSGVWHIRT